MRRQKPVRILGNWTQGHLEFKEARKQAYKNFLEWLGRLSGGLESLNWALKDVIGSEGG